MYQTTAIIENILFGFHDTLVIDSSIFQIRKQRPVTTSHTLRVLSSEPVILLIKIIIIINNHLIYKTQLISIE